MNKQDLLKLQTCVLKVNIVCDGCKQKVKKLLQKIGGVYSINIDAEKGKVTVIGNIDPSVLIKKLAKSGKHAEIHGGSQKSSNINQSNLDKLIKNIQIENENVAKRNKSQKGFQQTLPEMKGTRKDKDMSDHDFDDHQDGGRGLGPGSVPVGNHRPSGMVHVHVKKDKNGKKVEVVEIPRLIEGNGKGGKKDGSGGKKDGGEWNIGSGDKSGGGLLAFGRKAKGLFGFCKRGSKKKDFNSKDGGGIGKINTSGAKKKGWKNKDVQEFKNLENVFNGINISKQGRALTAGGGKNSGQTGQICNIPAVQGVPTSAVMDGGGYQVMDPYGQQYMGTMWTIPRTNENGLLQPTTNGPPYTAVNYGQPPPMPPPVASDPYTTYFNDENVDGCNVM